MSGNLDTTTSVHVYKPKFWTLLVNLLSFTFLCIIIGIPLFLLLFLSVSMLQNETVSMFGVGFLCFLGPNIILMSLVLIQQMVHIISMSFFSYVKVSSTGLEQRIWPYKHIRCNWSDVDRIGKWWLLTDVVYLKSCEIIGPSISLKMLELFRPSSQNFITLSGYRGWSEGQLAEDLRQFVPRLFEGESARQETVLSEPSQSSGLSQEERLLAALSHVSVLFSYVGIIVPIIIWATQKEKSTYTRFQALQALVWQATMFAFNLITPACIMCSVFAPIFMMPLAENETTSGVAFGGMFVMVMVITLLMAFGSLGFIVYGIIGAILTYQGKEFRYAIIANRLEKRGLGFAQQSRP